MRAEGAADGARVVGLDRVSPTMPRMSYSRSIVGWKRWAQPSRPRAQAAAALRPADAGIGEAGLRHLAPGRRCCAGRRCTGCAHQLARPLEVEAAELVPLGEDHQRVGARRSPRRRPGTSSTSGSSRRASRMPSGSKARTVAPSPLQRRQDDEAGALAHVVGVGLEGEAQHGDRLAGDAAAAGLDDLARPCAACGPR